MESDSEQASSKPVVSRHLDLKDVFYVLGLICLAVVVLRYTRDLVVPIVFALMVWFLINALAETLRSIPVIGHRLPLSLALSLASIVTISLAYSLANIIVANVAELSEGMSEISPKAEELVQNVEQNLRSWFGWEIARMVTDFKISELPISDWLPAVTGTLTATFSSVLLVILFVLFLMFDQPYYQRKMRALFPDQGRFIRATEILQRIGRDTRLYVRIMTAISIVVGLGTYAIASYFGVRGAAFWGFLAFALNYIPTVGSVLGVLFPALYALVQLDDLPEVGLFVVLLGVLQFVAGNLILPRVTGNQLNLSEFVVILSLSVFGELWGVAGLFLGVPVVMVLAIVLSQFDSTRPFAILLSKNGQVIRTAH